MRDHLSWRLTRHTRSPTRIAGNAGWATSASLPRLSYCHLSRAPERMECEPCRRCHGANRCRDRLCLQSDGSPSRPCIVAGDPHGLLYAQRVSRPPRARRLRGTPRHDPDWRRVAWPERVGDALSETRGERQEALPPPRRRHGLYTREAIAERKAMRALIRAFREDARAALGEPDTSSGSGPSRGGS
jgi:hypothetical protein